MAGTNPTGDRGDAPITFVAHFHGVERIGEGRSEADRPGLGFEDRARVIDTLAGDLDALADDAAKRGITERSATELLLTVAVLDWLRGGELPGKGAVDFMEDHLAGMNRARHEEEEELRGALRAVLEELVGAQQGAIAAGRWLGRDLDAEAVSGRLLRSFGRNLDGLRRSQALTIGGLADRAGMGALDVVAFIMGAEEPDAEALWRLAGALSIDPGQPFPPGAGAPSGGRWSDGDQVIGDVPGRDRHANPPEADEGASGSSKGRA